MHNHDNTQRRIQILTSHLLQTSTPNHDAIFTREMPPLAYLMPSETAAQSLPSSYKQLVVTKRSNNYREAAQVQEQKLETLKPTQVLIKVHYAGIQASDIMISNGVYGPLKTREPPMVGGAESVGVVVAKGAQVSKLNVGQNVLLSGFGVGFTEYYLTEQDSKSIIPLPSFVPLSPHVLALVVSGMTAHLAFKENGIDVIANPNVGKNKTMLVTAAAGATGSFAVQLAKQGGFHVIGTCSTDEKAKWLKEEAKCDRVINYKKEKLEDVLTKEYAKGVDVIYESVGGDMVRTAIKHLALYGKLIIIGMIESYKGNSHAQQQQALVAPELERLLSSLLFGSRTISGFFLFNSWAHQPKEMLQKSMEELLNLCFRQKSIKIPIEDKVTFNGIDKVYDAIDYLHAGKNLGKVYVTIAMVPSSQQPSASAPSAVPSKPQFGDYKAPGFELIAKVFEQILNAADPTLLSKINATFQYNLTSSTEKSRKQGFFFELKPSATQIVKQVEHGSNNGADCSITASEDAFVQLMQGKLSPQKAYLTGKVKIAGKMNLAMKLLAIANKINKGNQ